MREKRPGSSMPEIITQVNKLFDLQTGVRKSAESILPSFKENTDSNKISLVQKNV